MRPRVHLRRAVTHRRQPRRIGEIVGPSQPSHAHAPVVAARGDERVRPPELRVAPPRERVDGAVGGGAVDVPHPKQRLTRAGADVQGPAARGAREDSSGRRGFDFFAPARIRSVDIRDAVHAAHDVAAGVPRQATDPRVRVGARGFSVRLVKHRRPGRIDGGVRADAVLDFEEVLVVVVVVALILVIRVRASESLRLRLCDESLAGGDEFRLPRSLLRGHVPRRVGVAGSNPVVVVVRRFLVRSVPRVDRLFGPDRRLPLLLGRGTVRRTGFETIRQTGSAPRSRPRVPRTAERTRSLDALQSIDRRERRDRDGRARRARRGDARDERRERPPELPRDGVLRRGG
mmetsp:Transcript_10221/g.42160  ORF Transcript_10221/g.42160 Transcript_10221/m.42160 type:complete len:345 (+) Transcript_10221:1589-2623(+)